MKRLWKQNRVLLMLFVILFICFIAILSVALTFFYRKDVSEYGARLDEISKYELKKDLLNKYKESILDNNGVSKVELNVEGRIIYVHIDFTKDMTLENAKKIAESSLEGLGERNLSYYDVQFIMNSDNFTILGAKNFVSDKVSWNNNRPVETDEEENEDQD